MKTSNTVLSLLLAAVSTAAAEQSSNRIYVAKPFVSASGVSVASSSATTAADPAKPEATDPEVYFKAGEAVAGSGIGGGSTGFAVPTARVEQIDAPVDWKFVDPTQPVESAIREHFQDGPIAYLGVTTSQPAGDVAAQLAIPFGTGLVVNVVGEGSPAQKAGIQPHDVLTKLDDQILVDQGQLTILVVNHKEGDSVKVSLIRKGQPQEVAVTLGRRETTNGVGTVAEKPTAITGSYTFRTDGTGPQPLRTFIRRLDMPQEIDKARSQLDMSKEEIERVKQALQDELGAKLDVLRAEKDFAAERGKLDIAEKRKTMEDAESVQKSMQDQLQQMHAMLEDLTKKINEKK